MCGLPTCQPNTGKIPCKGFMLSNITSAHNPLQPRAPFFGTLFLPTSSTLVELRVLRVLLRRVPGASQKRKVVPSTQHCAVQGHRLKTSRNCPLAWSGSDLLKNTFTLAELLCVSVHTQSHEQLSVAISVACNISQAAECFRILKAINIICI